MKIGDKVPVTIAGQEVAQATVKELAEGTATLVVPAVLVVMATRTELTVEQPVYDDTKTETIITGVDRPVEAETAQEPPVVTNTESAEQLPVEPVVEAPQPEPVPEANE